MCNYREHIEYIDKNFTVYINEYNIETLPHQLINKPTNKINKSNNK